MGEAKIDNSNFHSQDSNSTITLTVPISNKGKRNGTEVVQVYIRNLKDTEGPLRSLRAFQRIDVKAGQTANATLKLDAQSFEFFDPQSNAMRTQPGNYEILYGNSSDEKNLRKLQLTIE